MTADHEVKYKKAKEIALDGAESYHIITSALARAKRQITSFTIGIQGLDSPEYESPGIPPISFNTNFLHATERKPKYQGTDITALSSLERCVLRVTDDRAEDGLEGSSRPNPLVNPIDGLQAILRSMDHLQYLELHLTGNVRTPHNLYTSVQALPADKVWTRLRSLLLFQMSSTTNDLLSMMFDQMPKLRHFRIGSYHLSQGSWQGFFEALALSKQLYSFDFESDTCLSDHDQEDFLSPMFDSAIEDLQKYITCGGRNPCLDSDELDEASDRFLEEFDEKIRGRLTRLSLENSGKVKNRKFIGS